MSQLSESVSSKRVSSKLAGVLASLQQRGTLSKGVSVRQPHHYEQLAGHRHRTPGARSRSLSGAGGESAVPPHSSEDQWHEAFVYAQMTRERAAEALQQLEDAAGVHTPGKRISAETAEDLQAAAHVLHRAVQHEADLEAAYHQQHNAPQEQAHSDLHFADLLDGAARHDLDYVHSENDQDAPFEAHTFEHPSPARAAMNLSAHLKSRGYNVQTKRGSLGVNVLARHPQSGRGHLAIIGGMGRFRTEKRLGALTKASLQGRRRFGGTGSNHQDSKWEKNASGKKEWRNWTPQKAAQAYHKYLLGRDFKHQQTGFHWKFTAAHFVKMVCGSSDESGARNTKVKPKRWSAGERARIYYDLAAGRESSAANHLPHYEPERAASLHRVPLLLTDPDVILRESGKPTRFVLFRRFGKVTYFVHACETVGGEGNA